MVERIVDFDDAQVRFLAGSYVSSKMTLCPKHGTNSSIGGRAVFSTRIKIIEKIVLTIYEAGSLRKIA